MEASSGRPDWVEHGKIGGIDGLRGYAILGVLVAHASHVFIFDESDPLATAAGFMGRLGVLLFFAISGFLITLLLLRERERSGSISLRGFYRRRTLRIIPAYVCYLAVVFAASGAGRLAVDSRSRLAALTYTMNFTPRPSLATEHIWTLSLEEQYYLIWPLVFAALGPRLAFRCLLAFMLAAPLLRQWLGPIFTDWDMDPARIFSSTTIGAGCILAYVVWDRRAWPRLNALRALDNIPTALVVATLTLACVCPALLRGAEVCALSHPVLFVIAASGPAWAAWRRVRFTSLLAHPILIRLGTLSYSLYLWQQPILMNNGWNDTLPFAARLALLLASASASYHLIERPFLRLKDRGSRASQGCPADAAQDRTAHSPQLRAADARPQPMDSVRSAVILDPRPRAGLAAAGSARGIAPAERPSPSRSGSL